MCALSEVQPMKGSYFLFVRRYAPFASFGGGFEGDGRGFSTNPEATARTVAVVTFGNKNRIEAVGFSSGSSWVGPWKVRRTHPRLSVGKVGKHIGQVRVGLTGASATETMVRFSLHVEGNLPLKDVALPRWVADTVDRTNAHWRPAAPRPQGTPDIDTYVDFSMRSDGDRVVFAGTLHGDGFPNAEVFVLDSTGKAAGLLDYRTRSGVMGPLFRLFGTGAQNELGRFVRRVAVRGDGTFADAGNGPVVVKER